MKNERVKAIFSVSPISGKKSVEGAYGLEYVNRREVAIEGLVRVTYSNLRGGGWRDKRLLESPTYGQLFSAAQRMLNATGDYHQFFEGFSVIEGNEVLPDGRIVRHVELWMGS